VVGVDPHELSIDQARRIGGYGITYVHADALDVELAPADVVTSVAMLHHVDMVGGLRVMASLVAPGGLLLVVGVAKCMYPARLPLRRGRVCGRPALSSVADHGAHRLAAA
jgi:2-polyprenyl-3-methyl-5-hydroxy-6-metoxy-1,4-benzoquinol methylase